MSAPQARDEYVGYREAATLAGVTYDAIAGLVQRGRLHAIKFPGDTRKYILRAEVEAYRDKIPWAPGREEESPEVRGRAIMETSAAALREHVEALSAPTVEALGMGLQALRDIAVAAAMGAAGASAGPKARA